MTSSLEKIRQAREDAHRAKAELEERIIETRNEIRRITKSGTLPFDEAWPAWRESFERYADGGRETLERSLAEYARPNAPNPATGSITPRSPAARPFQTFVRGNGQLDDPGPVMAHIHRDQIIEHARTWFENTCSGDTVPPESERQAEAARLVERLRALEQERDDIADELASLFKSEPSERTQQAQHEQARRAHVDMLNAPRASAFPKDD